MQATETYYLMPPYLLFLLTKLANVASVWGAAMITCFTRYTMHTLSKIVLHAKMYDDKKTFRCLEHEPLTIVTTLHSIPRFRYFRIFITFQTIKYCTPKHAPSRMKKRQQQSEITFDIHRSLCGIRMSTCTNPHGCRQTFGWLKS